MWGGEKALREVLENQSPCVIVGRTRSGKTYTLARSIEIMLATRRRVIVVDWAGQLELPGLMHRPRLSFKLVRDMLPDSLALQVASQGSTSGTWTRDSLFSAMQEADSWEGLIDSLRQREEFPYRDPGARAARVRLEPLLRYGVLTNDDVEIGEGIYDFSHIPLYSRNIAVMLFLAQLYTTIASRGLSDVAIFVDEAWQLSEDLVEAMLNEVAGYGVKAVVVYQALREWHRRFNLVIHNIGLPAAEVVRYGIPPKVEGLAVGEAMVYNVERHRWRKVRVRRPQLIVVRPKCVTPPDGRGEAPPRRGGEEGEAPQPPAQEAEEAGGEEGEREEIRLSRDPRVDRILEEHRVLSDEIRRLERRIEELSSALSGILRRMEGAGARLGQGNDGEVDVDRLVESGLLIKYLQGRYEVLEVSGDLGRLWGAVQRKLKEDGYQLVKDARTGRWMFVKEVY
ncbi:hypothetical protein B6U99_02165 [Candidatus Geothermarchaeota archaeon ex4572_27]|nr:MAG: hypothetical protein B6U99_02165 [Candidatus Geothermarchaeota archaeon ex4572_27]